MATPVPSTQTPSSAEDRFKAAGIEPEQAADLPRFNNLVGFWMAPSGLLYDAHAGQDGFHPNHSDSAVKFIVPDYRKPEHNQMVSCLNAAYALGWVRINISPSDSVVFIEHVKALSRTQKDALQDLAFSQDMPVEDDNGRRIIDVRESTETIPWGISIQEGRLDQARKKYSKLPEEAWNKIVAGQPAGSKGKYLDWMGKEASKHIGEPEFESIVDEIIRCVAKFDKLKSSTDLYSIKSLENLWDFFEHEARKGPSKKEKLRQDLPVVFEDDQWKIYQPESHEAMQKVGGGTKWCVATSNPAHWKSYWRNGAFLVIKAKKPLETYNTWDGDEKQLVSSVNAGERWAIYCRAGSNVNGLQVYNEDDKDIGYITFRDDLLENFPDVSTFIEDWESNVDDEVYARRESMEDVFLQDYCKTDQAIYDLVEYWAHENGYDKYISPDDIRAKFKALPADAASVVRDAIIYTAKVEETDYRDWVGTIDSDRYEEMLSSEMSDELRKRFDMIMSNLAGFSRFSDLADPDQDKDLKRKYGKNYDAIIAQATDNIARRDHHERSQGDQSWGRRDQQYLDLGVPPAPQSEVNKNSLKKELNRMGYPDLAAALGESLDAQADALLERILGELPHPSYATPSGMYGPERVVAAAWVSPDGEDIITGEYHLDAVERAQDAGFFEEKYNWSRYDNAHYTTQELRKLGWETGFITNKKRFVSRQEGLKLAKEREQLNNPNRDHEDYLDSFDIVRGM